MNEKEYSSCALPHHTDNWNTIVWCKVIQRVSRLQRRIAKAVKEGRWSKAKALMYLVSNSFKYWIEKLPSNQFCQIHRSFLINLKHIQKVSGSKVFIINQSIPIGRVFKKEFQNRYIKCKDEKQY